MTSFTQILPTNGEMHKQLERIKTRISTDQNSVLAQQEAFRRATLLKHRKVSTQLKLDMVHRQLSDLRRSVHESDTNHQFYRNQVAELSNELQDLGSALERVERNAYFVRRRMLSGCDDGLDVDMNDIPLSSSHNAIYSSSETLDHKYRSSVRSGFKSRAIRLLSTPPKLRKKLLFGELRAVASLSSLNIKSTSQTTLNEDTLPKDSKSNRKGPLRFLGNLVDNQIRRRFWNSTKRAKSAGNVLDHKSTEDINKECNVLRVIKPNVVVNYSSSTSSDNSDEDEDDSDVDDKEQNGNHDVNGKVGDEESEKQKSNIVKTQVDPNLLAEIEDFEKMAAQFISQQAQRTPS